MHPRSQARSGYDATSVRTERGTEYALFAQITSRLKAIDEADLSSFPALASAVADNQRLWATLAEDLMSDANRLPVPLRVQLISLAEFVRKHSLAVLGGRARIGTLIDINTAIMKGLRGNLEAAA
jgi:flagellar biosynthesis activator protein FlaF